MKGERPTQARIDLDALAANHAEARRLARGRDVVAVVKADGYGHGAVPVARRLVAAGCTRLAVMTVAEAAELRAAAVETEILVLGGVHDAAEAADAVAARATPVVQHPDHLPLLAEAAGERGARLPVHVEVDTGMRRMGIPPGSAARFLAEVAGEDRLRLAGVHTHLARADEADLAPSREQLARFAAVLEEARAAGVAPGLVHVANSAGLLAGDGLEDALPPGVGAVRPGLCLYGVRPAPHLPGTLRPVMTLHTRVANVRAIRPGEAVGYGATFRAERPGRIATLPLGYADGVPWAAGGRGEALVRGRRVPFAGRVSMDLVTLDCGDLPVEIGDEAVLFGEGLPVEEAAAAAGTIPYELLVRVGRRVPRVLAE